MPNIIENATVFYINLDFRTDRREHMEAQLQSCPLPVHRISAVRLEADPVDLGYTPEPHLVGQRNFLGIWLSHRNALRHARSLGVKGPIVILEDDVVVDERIWKSGIEVSSDVNWRMILLNPRFRKRKREEGDPKWAGWPFDKVVKMRDAYIDHICTGAHFCVIKDLSVAEDIMEKMDKSKFVYDVDAFYVREILTYGLRERLVSISGFSSDH